MERVFMSSVSFAYRRIRCKNQGLFAGSVSQVGLPRLGISPSDFGGWNGYELWPLYPFPSPRSLWNLFRLKKSSTKTPTRLATRCTRAAFGTLTCSSLSLSQISSLSSSEFGFNQWFS